MNTRTTSTLLIGIALSAAVGLAGCTGHGTGEPSRTPSPSHEPVAESIDGKAPATGTCDHGQMTVTEGDLEPDRTFVVAQTCDLVAVLASDAHVVIQQDIPTLTVEGSNTTVTAEGIERSLNLGGNNTVQYTGKAPKQIADDDSTHYEQR